MLSKYFSQAGSRFWSLSKYASSTQLNALDFSIFNKKYQQVPIDCEEDGPIPLLNQNVRNIGKAGDMILAKMQERMQNANPTEEFYRLGLMKHNPFPTYSHMVNELNEWSWRKDYLPARGLEELKESIANYFNTQDKTDLYTSSNVIVSPGSNELILLLLLAYPGDILLPNPSLNEYITLCNITNRNISIFNTCYNGNYKLNMSELQEYLFRDAYKPRILLLSNPNIINGKCYNESEIIEITNLCKKHQITILCDESNRELVHNHNIEYYSFSNYYYEGTIKLSNVDTFVNSNQWRLASFIFPSNMKWLLDAIAVMASETYTTTSAPIQHACISSYNTQNNQKYINYQNICNKVYKNIINYCYNKLTLLDIHIPYPDSGYNLFCDFTKCKNIKTIQSKYFSNKSQQDQSTQLSQVLLENCNIFTLPNVYYNRPEDELSITLSLNDFNGYNIMNKYYDSNSTEPFDVHDIPSDITHPELKEEFKNIINAIHQLENFINNP